MTQTCRAKNGAEAAVATLRAMVSIGDSTLARVTGQVTVTQFRALRTVAAQTPVTMSRVAEELGMNPSSVTRACEKLVALDLLQRARNPLNKRETLLAPSAKGRELVARVDQDRRTVLAAILDRLEPESRTAVIAAFEQFAAAAAATGSTPQD